MQFDSFCQPRERCKYIDDEPHSVLAGFMGATVPHYSQFSNASVDVTNSVEMEVQDNKLKSNSFEL